MLFLLVCFVCSKIPVPGVMEYKYLGDKEEQPYIFYVTDRCMRVEYPYVNQMAIIKHNAINDTINFNVCEDTKCENCKLKHTYPIGKMIDDKKFVLMDYPIEEPTYWYRYVYWLPNPVDVCNPDTLSQVFVSSNLVCRDSFGIRNRYRYSYMYQCAGFLVQYVNYTEPDCEGSYTREDVSIFCESSVYKTLNNSVSCNAIKID